MCIGHFGQLGGRLGLHQQGSFARGFGLVDPLGLHRGKESN